MPKAIIFDFDQTLSPDTILDPVLKSWGLLPSEFWSSCTELQASGFDMELAYLYRMVQEGRENHLRQLDSEGLFYWGGKVELYPGLCSGAWGEGLFQDLSKAGNFEAFIVSGALKLMIQGCLEAHQLSGYFSEVFACQMAEEEASPDGPMRLSFPKETVGFTAKTQKLFSISKGSWKPGGPHVNAKIRDKSFTIPFADMLYLGDGLSDIAAFATLKRFGGSCFAVHAPGDEKAAERARSIAEDGRAHAFFEADYRPHSPLRRAILDWLTKI